MGAAREVMGKLMDLVVMTACLVISVTGIIVVYSWNGPHKRDQSPWDWRSISSWVIVVSTVTAQLVRRGALSWAIFLTVPNQPKGTAAANPYAYQQSIPRDQANPSQERPQHVKWGRIFATTYGVGHRAKVVYMFLVLLGPLLPFIPIRFVNEASFKTTVQETNYQLYFHASDSDHFSYSTTGVYEAIKLAYRYSNGAPLRTQDIYAEQDAERIYLPRKMPGACRHNRTQVFGADILVGQYTCTSTANAPPGAAPADVCGTPPPTKAWLTWESKLDESNVMRHSWLDNAPSSANATSHIQGLCVHYRIPPATPGGIPISTLFSCSAAYYNATAAVTWRANGSDCWIDAVADVSPLETQYTTNTRLLAPMRELNIGITNALIGAVNATDLATLPLKGRSLDAERTVGTIFTAATLLRSLYKDSCSEQQAAAAVTSGRPSYCRRKPVSYEDWEVRRGFEPLPLIVVCLAYGLMSLGAYVSFVVFEMFSSRPKRFWDGV